MGYQPKSSEGVYLYEEVLRPFIEPVIHLSINTGPKLVLGGVSLLIANASGILDTVNMLTYTPLEYWLGLMIVTTIDFITGTIRAIVDPRIRFDGRKFVRGTYKFVLYPTILIMSAITTNMFPEIFGLFQYIIVAALVGQEMYSFFRNIKMVSIFLVAINIVRDKAFPNGRNFMDMVEDHEREILKRKQQENALINDED